MTRARTLALVDVGWGEADVLLDGARRGDLDVRLVLGAGHDDPGLRVARLLGVPHSTDVVDLTRELFDVAVIGAASPRRAALERLLESLGATITRPESIGGAPAADAGDNGSPAVDDGPWGSAEAVPADAEAAAATATPAWTLPGPDPLPPQAGALRVEADELVRAAASAVQRQRLDGSWAALHRVGLASAAILESTLPARFRAGDRVCRPDPWSWVMLCAGPSASPDAIRRRVLAAWFAFGQESPPPEVSHEQVRLEREADAASFEARARAWVAPPQGA